MLKKKRAIYIIIITILALLLLLVTVGSLLINSYLSKVQYDTGDQAVGIEDIQEPVLTDEEIIQELLADEPISDELDSAHEEVEKLEEQMASQLAQNNGSKDFKIQKKGFGGICSTVAILRAQNHMNQI